jgi:hypothetical protein
MVVVTLWVSSSREFDWDPRVYSWSVSISRTCGGGLLSRYLVNSNAHPPKIVVPLTVTRLAHSLCLGSGRFQYLAFPRSGRWRWACVLVHLSLGRLVRITSICRICRLYGC